MHQHGARIDELLDLELLQRAQQAPRALDSDGLVERVVLAGEIEIGDEVDDARDARAERVAELAQRQLDRSIGREVDLQHREVRALRLEIQAD